MIRAVRYIGTACLVATLLFTPQVRVWAQAESFESLAQKAAVAREANHAEEAIRYYKDALELRPNWDEGLWYMGTIYYDLDRYADAVPAFQRLVVIQPKAGTAWNLLGLSEFEIKDYGHALPDLQRALTEGIDDPPGAAKVTKYHVAMLLNLNGQFEQAAQLLSTEFAQGPVPDQIKTVLGLAFLRVPLLPAQVDPSKDALVQSAGEAGAFLVQGNSEQALPAIQQMLKDYPDASLLHYAYAVALDLASHPDAAAEQLHEQIRLAPDFAPAHQLLARVLQKLGKTVDAGKESEIGERLTAKLKETDSAQEAAYARSDSKAVARWTGGANGGGNFDELVQQAKSAQQAGNYEAALAAYQRAVAVRPEWDEGWNMIGTLHYMSDRCAEAIPAFKTSTGINPKRSEAWALLGICEFQTKDYKNSLIHLQQAMKLGLAADPTGIKIAKYHLALLLDQEGEFDQAMDLLIPEVGPSSMADQIKLAMGLALIRIPQLPDQLGTSQLALVKSAGDAAAALAESKYDQAFPIFQQMLKDAPDTPYLHYAYGVALASNSQYDEAKVQLREETRLNPTTALPYMRLASIALLLHSPEDALGSAQRASELAPNAAEGHYLLGRALLELKRFPDAVKPLETASKLAPGSPQVHFNLAKAYAKAGQPEAADKEREVFTRLNALAEKQKGMQGSQTYAGSHSQTGLASESTGSTNPE